MNNVPPQNLEAEESVLGAMLMSKDAIDRVESEGLKAEDFYRESHGIIFSTACELHARNEPVDAITMHDALEAKGKLEAIGGRVRVHELAALVPATSNAHHYAKIVREQAAFRRLARAGAELQRLGFERPGDLDDVMAMAEAAMQQAVAPTVTTQFQSLADQLDDVIAQIEEAVETGQVRFGLKTGFYDLDAKLTGLHPGQLILIAARPGMGKSALALNIAENVADEGIPAALLTLEMSKEEIGLRSLSRASRIDSKRLRTGRIPQELLSQFRAGCLTVKGRGSKLAVEDNAGTTIQKLRAEARRLQRTSGLKVLVVDYLQLMLSSQSSDSRQQEISAISRGLKLLARELGIPVIALSQLNRNLEVRENKRPFLSDLRDSGSLEQDADVVLFIYRDDYYNPDSGEQGVAEIIVAKNRQGEGGTVKLGWKAEHTEFRNLASGLAPIREEAA